MIDKQNIPLIVSKTDDDRTNCPVCGMAVRLERRTYSDNSAYCYSPILIGEEVAAALRHQDPETAAKLKEARKGKKTVAMVGLAPTSCSLAPFDDLDCEIWALNEAHAFMWLTRATRWFQIHATESWQRYIAKRDVRGHADWLRKNPLDIPIYMQYYQPEVPKSLEYPLHDVCDKFLSNFWRGDNHVKYFTSTLAYMMGVALLDNFERIEIYGFELSDEIEYVKQKACAEFWIGLAMGRGVEVYTPPNCQILYSDLYGGNEQGDGWIKLV
jgi:hypothetical protein